MCSRPEGWVGTMMLRMMNMSHSPYARWHLSFVDWHDDWTVLDEGCGGGKRYIRNAGR